VPTAGFNVLFCEDSVNDYARTIARCLYFLEKQSKLQNATRLELMFKNKVDPKAAERAATVEALVFEAMCEVASGKEFIMESFMEMYYVVAPNGAINRTAQFVQHIAVHLLYLIRGVYVLKCVDASSDATQAEHWSEQFLSENHDNVISAIQTMKRIAARNIEEPDCKIAWLDDGLEVRTNRGNIPIKVFDIRSMYYDFLSRSKDLLADMDIPILSATELGQAVDLNTKDAGEGIMSMNAAIIEARQEDAASLPACRSKSDAEKKDFCNRSYQLGKLLVMALYLSGGPSARLTEISSWLIANTGDNAMRNLRFVRSLIAVVNTYSKSNCVGVKTDANIACFADLQLSALVMTYLIVVKRFENIYYADEEIFGPEAHRHSRTCFLVNKGQPITGVTLGKIFRNEFLGHGLDVSISEMRQVMEAYARKIGCLLIAEVSQNPLLQMSNHTAKTSNARYGKSNLDLPHVPADRMQECFTYCEHWNKEILHSETRSVAVLLSHQLVSEKVDTLSTQVLKKPCISSSVPALDTISSLPVFSHPVQSEILTLDSPCTQALNEGHMMTDVLLESPASPHNEGSSIMQDLTPSVPTVRKRRRNVDLHDALPILGMENLRETQSHAYKHMCQHQAAHTLIIVPTGSGKTKIVYVDAIVRRVCNVLFVPYVAISREVSAEGSKNPNLKVVSWSSIRDDFETTANTAQVVVASFEHAGQNMISFIQTLNKLGRLGYFFVDEADTLLHTYRAFDHFWTLAAACSLVTIRAMTATLRPSEQPHLARMLGVDLSDLKVMRKPCMRDDISLSTRFFHTDAGMFHGIQVFLQGLPECSTRIMIFVMSIKEAEDLGAFLELHFPNQVSISHSQRRDELGRVAVVTSCFGYGLNIVGLTHVVIFRSSWSCENLVQAMGRLRQPGTCTIFTTNAGLQKIICNEKQNAYARETAQLLNKNRSPGALKRALSDVLDKPQNPDLVSDAEAAIPNFESSFRFDVFQRFCHGLQSQIAEIAPPGNCSFCIIMGRPGANNHVNYNCPAAKGLCNRCFNPGHCRCVRVHEFEECECLYMGPSGITSVDIAFITQIQIFFQVFLHKTGMHRSEWILCHVFDASTCRIWYTYRPLWSSMQQ